MLVFQATAEQIRLAEVIYDKNDADFEDKIKQVLCSAYPCIEKYFSGSPRFIASLHFFLFCFVTFTVD